MKKVIILTLFLLFALGCAFFWTKTVPVFDLAFTLFLGLSIGLIILVYLIRVYSNPPKWLFRLRFVIYNFQYGLFFGIAMSVFKLIDHRQINILEFVFNVFFFALFDFLFGLSAEESYFKFRKLIKKTSSASGNDLALIDLACYVDSDEYRTLGRLILEKHKLYFYSADENKCLFESDVSDISPVVEKSSFLNIPKGLDFQTNETKIFMKFPYYWLNVIKNEQSNLLGK